MNRAEGYNHSELQLRSSLTHSKNTVFWGTHLAQFAGNQGGFTVHTGFWRMSRSSPQPAKGHPEYGTQREQKQGHSGTEGYSRGREFSAAGQQLWGNFVFSVTLTAKEFWGTENEWNWKHKLGVIRV